MATARVSVAQAAAKLEGGTARAHGGAVGPSEDVYDSKAGSAAVMPETDRMLKPDAMLVL